MKIGFKPEIGLPKISLFCQKFEFVAIVHYMKVTIFRTPGKN